MTVEQYKAEVWAKYVGFSLLAVGCAALSAAFFNSLGTEYQQSLGNVFMLPFVGWTAFACLVYGIAVKFALMTHTEDLATYKAEVKQGLLFNPITFLAMLVMLPAWPFIAVLACVMLVAVWTKQWLKGGRFAENASVMTTPRVYCEKDDIVHTGACPKCGYTNGTPVNHFGR